MSKYRVIVHPDFRPQFQEFRRLAPSGSRPVAARAAMSAMRAVRDGQEANFRGERLGFDRTHYDLRDCAEIKVELVREYAKSGRRLGPSHRLIYREFEPVEGDQRPIRQIIAFEHRKNGKPFKVAAERLGRDKGVADPRLVGLPTTRPAVGQHKDPNRPISPHRMPLPPDLAAVLSTTQKTLPTRARGRPVGAVTRTADPPIRHPVRDR
ncbi:hypothetical protein GCM10011575_00840 [Microlunatus endophyticus]|uniref:Uncharacterized protein n=1 Tax=Microlunatus endophyticus TaxID=1716077 RepID=A0A917S0E7_9ACTN|nr:hypothetical protein GCM10011575_00840 [Microlunatus endophyticus]